MQSMRLLFIQRFFRLLVDWLLANSISFIFPAQGHLFNVFVGNIKSDTVKELFLIPSTDLIDVLRDCFFSREVVIRVFFWMDIWILLNLDSFYIIFIKRDLYPSLFINRTALSYHFSGE